MKCPHCSKESPPDAEECPNCGLIFARLEKLREEGKLPASAEPPPPHKLSPEPLRPPALKASPAEKARQEVKGRSRLVTAWRILGGMAAFDAFIISQGILSMMLGLPVALVLLIVSAVTAVRDKTLTRWVLLRRALGILAVLGLLVYVPANNMLARRRADVLIKACYEYKEKHGDFPDKLEDLVPDIIPKVPRAKYTLNFGEFSYRKGNLMWVSIPPFGRPYYDFYRERWGFLD